MLDMRAGKTTFNPPSTLTKLLAWLILLAAVPTTAPAAERFAIFRSIDRGRSWTQADQGMPEDSRINAFGSCDDSVFAGTDSGILISRDKGQSWQPASGVEMTTGRILSFATVNGNAYAGTGSGGILVSSDKGISWASQASFPSVKVRSLLVHRGELYAGTDAEGVFVSGDGGRSWIQLENGLPPGAQVFTLAGVNGRIFAGLYSKGLYSWHAPDQRWLKAGEVLPLALASVGGTLVAGHNPGGIHWSENPGVAWARAAMALGPSTASLPGSSDDYSTAAPVWELASSDDLAVAGVADGIFYSEDHGRNWARARHGLPDESPGISFLMNRDFILAGTVISN